MKIFETEVIDKETGFTIVLTECSYNVAMAWLETECKKYNFSISVGQISLNTRDAYGIRVLRPEGTLVRQFIYDEERGYLLGE